MQMVNGLNWGKHDNNNDKTARQTTLVNCSYSMSDKALWKFNIHPSFEVLRISPPFKYGIGKKMVFPFATIYLFLLLQ